MSPKKPSAGVFICTEPGCKNRAFSNKSNLERHVRTKHGVIEMVEMPCKKLIKKNNYNIERHIKRCDICKAARPENPKSHEAGPASAAH